ncbi:MAG: cobalt ECF transporter T component CbiQ [Candidatus Methanoperedens sp.]|nr:cobalt ECF transporter T component CbiQ [Candidatus Methanoperedens sp.]
MPEWLGGDPLNGIVITVAFFISLIIGRYISIWRTHIPGKIMAGLDPRIKLLVSFFIIITLTFMKHWYFPILISALCIIISLKFGLTGSYFKKLIFPLVMGIFILAVQSLTYGETKIDSGIIPVYAEGLDYGFLIFSRVLASASVLILLVMTTSQNDVLDSMRWFRAPQTIIDILSFMIRYIRTFSKEGKQMKLAFESRCGSNTGFRSRAHNAASISAVLILRASSKSDGLYRAMVSRGWKPGQEYPVGIASLDKGDIILGVALVAGAIGLAAIDSFA